MAYVISLIKIFGRKECKYIARIGNIISSDLSNLGVLRKFVMTIYQKVLKLAMLLLRNQKQWI